jgi:hypothetical protein
VKRLVSGQVGLFGNADGSIGFPAFASAGG